MSNVKLSVIMPVYKVEKYLREAIESVLNQPCKDLELICVDDGSPDNSGSICDEYARKDERVKVIHKENEGVAVARNVGMNVSNGQWIAFLDSDDKWVNGFYIKEVNDLLQGPGKAYAFKYIKGSTVYMSKKTRHHFVMFCLFTSTTLQIRVNKFVIRYINLI